MLSGLFFVFIVSGHNDHHIGSINWDSKSGNKTSQDGHQTLSRCS